MLLISVSASCFNPRAPCGARLSPASIASFVILFQSTRPVRGATLRPILTPSGKPFQSTRPVRGATMKLPKAAVLRQFQSTRPVRGATSLYTLTHTDIQFQSTRPVRGATAKKVTTSLFCHIFMGLTRHEYGLLGAYVPHPSFDVVHAPIFLHFIFCLLHLRTPKST